MIYCHRINFFHQSVFYSFLHQLLRPFCFPQMWYLLFTHILSIIKSNFNSNPSRSYHQCIEISINLRSKWVVHVSLQWTEERNTINQLIITNIIWELVFSKVLINILRSINISIYVSIYVDLIKIKIQFILNKSTFHKTALFSDSYTEEDTVMLNPSDQKTKDYLLHSTSYVKFRYLFPFQFFTSTIIFCDYCSITIPASYTRAAWLVTEINRSTPFQERRINWTNLLQQH